MKRLKKAFFAVLSVSLGVLYLSSMAYAYYWHTESMIQRKSFSDMSRSLALDSNRCPHLAYGGNHLYYAYYDGDQWHMETVDSSTGVGEYASLALDSSDHPHIAYYDHINGDLKYAYYDGDQWHIETVDNDGDVGRYASLSLDSTGNPHIAYVYVDDYHYTSPKYAYYDGSQWHVEPVTDDIFPPRYGSYTSLSLDISGQPHITYISRSSHALMYAHYNENHWEIETVDDDEALFKKSSLLLDDSGKPHIIYWDNSHRVVKYAYYDGTQWHIETIDNGFVWNNSCLSLDNLNRPHTVYAGNGFKYAYYDGTQWHIETVDTDAEYASICLDDNNNVHIVYSTYAFDVNLKELKYAYYDGTQWHIETVDTETHDIGQYASLALDSNDLPHIACYDSSSENLVYVHYDSNQWHIDIPDSDGDVGQYTSLALDNQNRPHIAYGSVNASWGSFDLKYAYYAGDQWHIVDPEHSSGSNTNFSLLLDSYGNPHIAYTDASVAALKYAYYDGEHWHIEKVDDNGSPPSLSLDSNGNPHIAYFGKYAYYDGTQWHIETIDTGSYYIWHTSLDLDSQDRPHIVYYCHRDFHSGDLKYAYYDGEQWHIETVDNDGDVGQYASLSLDSQGRPHIAYYDDMGMGHGTLKYAYYDGEQWHIETVDNDGDVGQYASLSLDTAGNPHIAYYDRINGILKYAYALIDRYGLELNLAGNGSGNVTSQPAGIDCGDVCQSPFMTEENVTITATPDEGSVFSGWGGDCASCGEDITCTIAMDGDKTCTATFDKMPPVIDNFSAEPLEGAAPLAVSFSCEADDSNGNNIAYGWDFDGDGNIDTYTQEATTSYTYEQPGTYNAYCHVFDEYAETISEGIEIHAEGMPRIDTYVTKILLSEDFSDGIPDNWQIENGGTDDTWTTENPCNRSVNSVLLLSPWAIIDSDCAGDEADQDDSLITPAIPVNENGSLLLSFAQYLAHYQNEKADVDISTDNGATWQNVLRMQGSDFGPENRKIDLTSYVFPPQNILLRFHYYDATYEWYWIIDNVEVKFLSSSADFGDVNVGDTSEGKNITIENSGSDTLTVSSLEINGSDPSDFNIVGGTCPDAPFTLAKGHDCIVAVAFSPQGPGEKNAEIQIFSDDPGNPTRSVMLTGTGVGTTFSLSVDAYGNGTVESEPAGIACGETCSSEFAEGASITLTAIPDGGSIFSGWGGDCASCGEDTTCTIAMDGDKTCTASFEAAATPSWQDITEMVTTSRSRTLYDRIHRAFFVFMDVENTSSDALSGPIRMVIEDPTIPVKTIDGVGLTPDGVTDDGDPYFIIVSEGESLGAGDMLEDLRVNFDLQRKRLNFGIRIEQLVLPPM